MRKRSLARELALKILYQKEYNNNPEEVVLDGFLFEGKQVIDFSEELVRGVEEKTSEIDKTIKEKATNWEIERMAVIDRTILRIATYEILFKDDIPHVVSINEAIELAKKYGSESSGSFVNGILDNIHRSLGE